MINAECAIILKCGRTLHPLTCQCRSKRLEAFDLAESLRAWSASQVSSAAPPSARSKPAPRRASAQPLPPQAHVPAPRESRNIRSTPVSSKPAYRSRTLIVQFGASPKKCGHVLARGVGEILAKLHTK